MEAPSARLPLTAFPLSSVSSSPVVEVVPQVARGAAGFQRSGESKSSFFCFIAERNKEPGSMDLLPLAYYNYLLDVRLRLAKLGRN